ADGAGVELAGHGERRGAERRDQPLASLLASGVEQESREADVVLDDEHDIIARPNRLPVVAILVDAFAFERFGELIDRGKSAEAVGVLGFRGCGGGRQSQYFAGRLAAGSQSKDGRQVQDERAAAVRRGYQANLPAQQSRQFAADRQAEPGATVLAARR